MEDVLRKRQEIKVVFLDRKSTTLDYQFLKTYTNQSRFWRFYYIEEASPHWRKRSSYNIGKAKKHLKIPVPITQQGLIIRKSPDEIRNWLISFLHELRIDLGVEKMIAVTRRSIPGGWFAISDYSSVTLVSINNWKKLFAPPPVEVFLLKTIMTYALLYSRQDFLTKPHHDETRGCIYDFCEDKAHIKASLWGEICGECRVNLKNWGVTQKMQSDAIEIIRDGYIFKKEKAKSDSTIDRDKTVFISYAHEDIESARKLYESFKRKGIIPWFDEKSLLAGERWNHTISNAIKNCRYFIAILSQESINKRGYVQKELKKALDVLDEFPDHKIFLIPVRIEECEPTSIKLHELNWVDMFPDWNDGFQRIMETIQRR